MATNNDLIEVEGLITKLTTAFEAQTNAIEQTSKKGKELAETYNLLPSVFKSNLEDFEKTNALMKSQDSIIASLTSKLKSYEETIVKNNQAKEIQNTITGQEKVNNQELAKNVDNLARQNSVLAGSYANLNAKAQEASKTLRNLIVEGKQAGQTQLEYNAKLHSAQSEFDNYNKKLLEADKAVGAWSRSNVRTIEGLTQLKTGLTSAINAFGIFTGVYLAAQVTMGAIDINKHLSDDLAQLQIYLKGTKKDADDVFESIKKLDTRTSLADLLGLAQIVAKKGVVKEEIAGIVKELDNLFLVLDDSAGNKEEFTASLVKIISLFNTQGQITAERVRDLGAAFVYLTTHGVATGDYLVDYTERLGASRSMTGQTATQVLGLGAAFQQLGQRVDVAGTGTGQIIAKMLTNVEKFAQKAKMPVEELKHLLLTDSSEALIRFSENLKNNSENTIEFAKNIEDLGIKGARMRSLISEIGANAELFRDKIEASNKAVEDSGKTAEDASLKQITFAATWDQVKKKFEKLVSDQNVQDLFSNLAILVLRLTQALTAIPFGIVIGGLTAWATYQALLKKEIISTAIAQTWNNEQTALGTVRMLAARLGLLGTAEAELARKVATTGTTYAIEKKIAVTEAEIIVQKQNIATLEAEILVSEENFAAKELVIKGSKARIATLEAEIVAQEAAIVENELLTASMASTPWGAIAVAIGIVVGVIYEMANAEDKATESLRKLQEQNEANLKISNKKTEELLNDKLAIYEANQRKLLVSHKISQEEFNKNIEANTQNELEKLIEAEDKRYSIAKKSADNLDKLQKERKFVAPKDNSGGYAARATASIAEEYFNKQTLKLQQLALVQKQTYDNAEKQAAEYRKKLKLITDKNEDKSVEDYEALTDKQQKAREKAEKERLKSIEENLRLQYERELSDLERKKELIQDEIKIDGKSKEELEQLEIMHTIFSIAIVERTAKEKLRIAKVQYKEELAEAGKSYQLQEIALKNFNNRKEIIENERQTNKENEIKLGQDREKKLLEDYQKEQDGFQRRIDNAENSQAINYYKRGISEKKFESDYRKKLALDLYDFESKNLIKETNLAKERAKDKSKESKELQAIQAEYNLNSQKLTEEYGKNLESIDTDDKAKAKKQQDYLNSFVKGFINKSQFKSSFKILNGEIDGFGKKWKATFLAMADVAKEAFSLINENSHKHFDQEYALAEKQHNISIAFAGNSTAAKIELDRQYEEKKKEIARREAETKKEETIFNIILSTAQGVIGASPDPALMAFIGAVGAIELAVAESQAIPKYFKGTDNAPAGISIVDELRPEVHTDRKGNIKSMGSEKGANFRMLESGDKIYKSREDYFQKELQSILLQNEISPFDMNLQRQSVLMVNNSNNGMSKADFDSGIQRLASTINEKEAVEMNISKKGLEVYVKNGHTSKQQLNDLFTSKGKKV